jgi:hypothetical protein
MKQKWRDKKYYRYGARFMERGGIYGRARVYPHTGGRIRRVFRTAIHINFREPDFQRTGMNAQAFNNQAMHVLLAYQMRPRRWPPPPPLAREGLPLHGLRHTITTAIGRRRAA